MSLIRSQMAPALLLLMFFGTGGYAQSWEQTTWQNSLYYRTALRADTAGSGQLYIAAVDDYEIYFNGDQVGADSLWTRMGAYPVQVASGDNHIAVKVTNKALQRQWVNGGPGVGFAAPKR